MINSLSQAAGLFGDGRHAEALKAISDSDSSVPADHLRGLCRLHLGAIDSAIDILQSASKRAPRDGGIARNLAIACRQAGRLVEATEAYERAFEVSKDALILIQLAEIDCDRNRLSQAKSRLRQVPADNPHHAAALATLASLHEQEGSDDVALELADRALTAQPDLFKAGYVRAVVLIKQRRHSEALATLDALRPDTPINSNLRAARRAECLFAMDQYDDGFVEVANGNRALAQSAIVQRMRDTSHYGPGFLERWSEYLTDDRLSEWGRVRHGSGEDPLFLTGFPRSGTTLLERMLSTLPGVCVIEEQPTLSPLMAALENAIAVNGDIENVEEVRYQYHDQVRQFVDPGHIAIDKMPLNSAFLALIFRVFPNARILFAVRDPRAVCLSCFRQSFGLNEAMAQFLGWQQTAQYYAQVMRLARHALDRLPMRHAFVRYESLVDNPREGLESVLEMLGATWNDDLLQFHARNERRINTPSYRQVTRPLYRGAKDEWQRFSQIAEIEPTLAPWLDYWGYR